jgi:hypothetical protein
MQKAGEGIGVGRRRRPSFPPSIGVLGVVDALHQKRWSVRGRVVEHGVLVITTIVRRRLKNLAEPQLAIIRPQLSMLASKSIIDRFVT